MNCLSMNINKCVPQKTLYLGGSVDADGLNKSLVSSVAQTINIDDVCYVFLVLTQHVVESACYSQSGRSISRGKYGLLKYRGL